MLKTNEEGDTAWTRYYGGADDDYGYCVKPDWDGGFIITGSTKSFTQDGNTDLWLLKTNSLGQVEGVAENPVSYIPATCEAIQPLGQEIILRYSDMPGGFRASVFDVSGQKVDELRSDLTSGTITWPVTPHPPGVYFFRIEGDASLQTRKVVLIR